MLNQFPQYLNAYLLECTRWARAARLVLVAETAPSPVGQLMCMLAPGTRWHGLDNRKIASHVSTLQCLALHMLEQQQTPSPPSCSASVDQ